ncbi:hypothetical protein PG987_016668 [Apiospora arundinis]
MDCLVKWTIVFQLHFVLGRGGGVEGRISARSSGLLVLAAVEVADCMMRKQMLLVFCLFQFLPSH